MGVSSLLTPPPSESGIPYDVVLEWIGLILDVHFTQLTLDKECHQLLLSLQAKVFVQVGVCVVNPQSSIFYRMYLNFR